MKMEFLPHKWKMKIEIEQETYLHVNCGLGHLDPSRTYRRCRFPIAESFSFGLSGRPHLGRAITANVASSIMPVIGIFAFCCSCLIPSLKLFSFIRFAPPSNDSGR